MVTVVSKIPVQLSLQMSERVLEVVEYAGDGAVLVLGSQGFVADVTEGDVGHGAIVVRVRHLHVCQVVLKIKHLG